MQKTIPLLLTLGFATLAHAGTNGFLVPFFRGASNSQVGYWETFSVPVGAPGNLPDKPGTLTNAVLTQSDPSAFLTGSGNIYNQTGWSSFTLSHTAPAPLGTVVLQVRTVGNEPNYSAIALTYTNGDGAHTLRPLPRMELNRVPQPGQGAAVSSLWQWDLSGLGVTAYALSFQAAGPSCSLDSLTLDTWPQMVALFTPPFALADQAPALERWMYFYNTSPCDRPAGSTFATFDESANVDTRHAQHLVGWDTAASIPTNRGTANYLVRRARLTLTIYRGDLFAYDPTHDDYRTYLPTNHPSYQPDLDAGRPIELFGVGYRNGFDVATFDQCAPFGSEAPGQRNAYAASFSTNGALVDVSNNVGKTNAAFPPFEAVPFAVGHTTNAAPGQLVPAGATFTFDLDLSNPFVLGYLQAGLNAGRLRFMVSSLQISTQFGAPNYPDFATHFNELVVTPTMLELSGVAMGSGDADADGLPDDWEQFWFQTLAYSATNDVDGDGLANLAEYRAGTDPGTQTNALRMAALQRDPSGAMRLQFPHSASRRYFIEYTDNLATWQRLTNAPMGYPDPASAQWIDDGTLTHGLSSNRFYRIVVEPSP